MTVIAARDLSDAGVDQMTDTRAEVYDPQLLAFAGITEAQLPKLVRSGEVIDPLPRRLPNLWQQFLASEVHCGR